MAVVPRVGQAIRERAGELVVDGRAVAPVDRAERLLEPHVVPVTVARDALQVELDAGFGQGLLEHLTRVGGAGEGTLGDLQLDGRGHARLLHVELGFVQIEGVLFLLCIEELHLGADAVVVAHRGVTREHVLDDGLTVNAVLERHHQIAVVERRLVGVGHEAETVAGTGRARQLDRWVALEQAGRFGAGTVDDIDLTGQQSLCAGCCIGDVAQFNAFEVAAVGLPVVAWLDLESGTHAGLEFFQEVGAGADRLAPILEPIGHHHDVVIAQVVRKVQVARLHQDLNRVRINLLHVGDVGQQGLGGRLGLTTVQVDGIDDVVSIQGLAVAEGDAFANMKGPVGRAGLDVPFFEQLASGVTVVGNLHQAVVHHQARGDHDGVGIRQRIQAVRWRATFHAHAQGAAFFGLGLRHRRQSTQRGRKADGGSAGQQCATVQQDARLGLRIELTHVLDLLEVEKCCS